MNDQPTPAVAQAIAEYERILAVYQEENARLTAGGADPALEARVVELYQSSLAAHARIAEVHAAEAAAPAGAPVAQPAASAQPADAAQRAIITAAPVPAPPAEETIAAAAPDAAPIAAPVSVAAVDDFDLSDPELLDAPAPAVPQPAEGVVLGRRPGIERFIPPPTTSSDTLRRDVLATRRTDTRPQLSRERKIAGDLPAWTPEPPNEVLQAAPRH